VVEEFADIIAGQDSSLDGASGSATWVFVMHEDAHWNYVEDAHDCGLGIEDMEGSRMLGPKRACDYGLKSQVGSRAAVLMSCANRFQKIPRPRSETETNGPDWPPFYGAKQREYRVLCFKRVRRRPIFVSTGHLPWEGLSGWPRINPSGGGHRR
jgi:hypothetical protein